MGVGFARTHHPPMSWAVNSRPGHDDRDDTWELHAYGPSPKETVSCTAIEPIIPAAGPSDDNIPDDESGARLLVALRLVHSEATSETQRDSLKAFIIDESSPDPSPCAVTIDGDPHEATEWSRDGWTIWSTRVDDVLVAAGTLEGDPQDSLHSVETLGPEYLSRFTKEPFYDRNTTVIRDW
ncbi:hypothetical protein [Brevibacterium litoralis]|uniref:hypothetical protein n=1 Tax=Brevibacterium litoralis TaxID=3138935 RepID=UPI0032EC0610